MIGNLIPLDRRWHNAKTNKLLRVTVNDDASVTMTTVSGQSRTVTPYDYRMDDHLDDEPGDGNSATILSSTVADAAAARCTTARTDAFLSAGSLSAASCRRCGLQPEESALLLLGRRRRWWCA